MLSSKVIGAAVGALILSSSAAMAWGNNNNRVVYHAAPVQHCNCATAPVQTYQTYNVRPVYKKVRRVTHKRTVHVTQQVVTHRTVTHVQPVQTHSYVVMQHTPMVMKKGHNW